MKRKTKTILGWGLVIIMVLSLTLFLATMIVQEMNCSYLFAIGFLLLIYLGIAVVLGLMYLAVILIDS